MAQPQVSCLQQVNDRSYIMGITRRANRERPLSTCAVTRRRFPAGANPARRPLQPEATGAGMEVTKCLKPPDSGHEIGDRASVQAATRVNAEQSSKMPMCRPTR